MADSQTKLYLPISFITNPVRYRKNVLLSKGKSKNHGILLFEPKKDTSV